jgi:hypothetical protein
LDLPIDLRPFSGFSIFIHWLLLPFRAALWSAENKEGATAKNHQESKKRQRSMHRSMVFFFPKKAKSGRLILQANTLKL